MVGQWPQLGSKESSDLAPMRGGLEGLFPCPH